MTRSISKNRKGFGLLEAMTTIMILLIAVVGSMAYQYHTTLDARKANLHSTALRICTTLLETWKGHGSGDDFDPAAVLSTDYSITKNGSSEPTPVLTNSIGSFIVKENDTNYFATLSYQDSTENLRKLNTTINWAEKEYGEGAFSDAKKSLTWTTYQGY